MSTINIDLTTMEGLNKAHADLERQIREARYALAAISLISATKCLEMGLSTTQEMIHHCVSVVVPAITLEKLKPGDTDLITGQVVPSEDEDAETLAKLLP